MTSKTSIDSNEEAGAMIVRSIAEIQRQINSLAIWDLLETHCQIKAALEEGVVELSNDPSLEERKVCYLGEIKLVHTEYWEWLKGLVDTTERECPERLRELPLDVGKGERVVGAMYALQWFLSGENDRLATYLNYSGRS
jgi:hypothetical protein